MTTFFEANQVRLIWKMKLSNYAWYRDCSVVSDNSEYTVLINVSEINNKIKKIIPETFESVSIRLKAG